MAVDGLDIGSVGCGLMILLGVASDDSDHEAEWLAEKTANLRIFEDAADKMNLSLLDTGGGALVVSQFTLYGDARRGRRPSFTDAAPPEKAERLYHLFVNMLRRYGIHVETGQFGARMLVSIDNDGPVTLIVDTP